MGAADHAVDGDYLARVHENGIADCDLLDRDVFYCAFGQPMRNSRGAVDQRFEVALGASNGKVLKHVATGVHDGHHGAGKPLPQGKSGRH